MAKYLSFSAGSCAATLRFVAPSGESFSAADSCMQANRVRVGARLLDKVMWPMLAIVGRLEDRNADKW